MKTVYSNKIGRNIHSPFVYKLIAHGLCAPYPFYAFAEIDKLGLGKNETEKLKRIFRLINFFCFEEVYLVGNNTEKYATICRLVRPGAEIIHSEKYDQAAGTVSNEGYQRLVIFGSVPDTETGYPIGTEVWLIDDLGKKELQKFFSGLKFVNEARITIEIMQTGIVVFNRIFEKQDYVIKP